MGPVNWLAAAVATLVAWGLGLVWFGPLFGGEARGIGRDARATSGAMAGTLVLLALSAVMLAHNYARLGTEVLAAKPWLFWMQSGGIALAFVIPALWISYKRQAMAQRLALIDAGYWLVAYLAMGTVFWVLR